MITKIIAARITKYEGNGQTVAYVEWLDSSGRTFTTSGVPKNLHMRALIARAKREGVTVESAR